MQFFLSLDKKGGSVILFVGLNIAVELPEAH